MKEWLVIDCYEHTTEHQHHEAKDVLYVRFSKESSRATVRFNGREAAYWLTGSKV